MLLLVVGTMFDIWVFHVFGSILVQLGSFPGLHEGQFWREPYRGGVSAAVEVGQTSYLQKKL
jgi:hypothetical protein